MDLITLTLNKNHLWTGISFLGLGTFTYLTNRYLTNTKETSNQTYYKPCEIIKGIPNLTILNNNTNNTTTNNTYNNNTNNNTNTNTNTITYLFWNGDMNSTYILLDLLLQDTIIQPLYIERYTIIKALEKDTLETILKNETNNKHNNSNNNNTNSNSNKLNSNSNKKYESYLKNIVLLKKNQEYELKQLEILRLMILSKYSEFKFNFLPTTYITSIAKDLEMTSHFFNTIKEIKPLYCDGIDFIEQVLRYIKYSGYIKNRNESNNINKNNNVARIILGCTKDYKNYDLVLKLISKNTNNIVFIDIPLKEIDNTIVKQRCKGFFSNDIMLYFNNHFF